MQKFAQKVTSLALAATMLFSMFSTGVTAFAEEIGEGGVTVSSDEGDAPGVDTAPADEGTSEDTGTTESTETPTPEPVPNPTQLPDGVVALDPEGEATEVILPSQTPDSTPTPTEEPEPTPEPEPSEEPTGDTETGEEPEQPEEPEFVGLQVLSPESGDTISADVGEELTLQAILNRDDVEVTYQWQKKQDFVADEAMTLYSYVEGEPTWYSFILEDTTETEFLAEHPDYTWQGCEMYYAIMAALDDIGEDSSNVQVAWHTPNYYVEGYTITAGVAEDGTIEVYASNAESTYTARLNDEGKWEFSTEATDSVLTEWRDIEGATEANYTFTVTYDDYTASYRCLVTVTDEAYREANFAAIEALGTELTEEDKAGDIVLSTVQFRVAAPDVSDEPVEEAVMPQSFRMLASSFAMRSVGGPSLSSNNQWITGLNGNYEYLTKNMYDHVTGLLQSGAIDKATADRYWTRIGGSWATTFTANVLDNDGNPTGGTRIYNGFPLTDGNMLEVNSEWYGQTVYFRPHNDTNAWTVTGTAIDVPAYTAVIRTGDTEYGTGASGTKYKDAVVFLNPWVSDAGRMYENYIRTVTSDGWLTESNGARKSQHITVLSVLAEQFNQNPDEYMIDAEGNYRIDSIGWGVCVSQEPDLSGKAYYAVKAFLGQGYGLCVGHDTMYAYAGAWYDAHVAGYVDPGSRDYYENNPAGFGPDPNDTQTRYYHLNSVPNFDNGHWNMNALMGANGGNIDSGTVLPTDAISMILSTGGSHSSYGKAGTMYGSDQLHVALRPYSNAQAQATVKYRNPTNFPYDIPNDLSAALTHSNSQTAFGPIWVNYAGGNKTGAEFGYNPNPTTKVITDSSTGRSWFGTSNFYLSGTGNFLMNQIGHLPENKATTDESALFANTVMYISQRKQCEICSSNQNYQEDVHFVIRVNSVNYREVLSALQQGGTFWYPLNGCYQVTDDLTLPEGWEPIKNFSGHWNSDVYKINLATNGKPLFDNTSEGYSGRYSVGSENGWNLGPSKEQGMMPVLKVDNQPDVRITGIARVLGDLDALFPLDDGVTDYTGWTVIVHGSDGQDYNCKVNGDNKYVISNVPCTGLLRAEVHNTSGHNVTEYGIIVVDVPNRFWNDCETHPLKLLEPTADPIEDYKNWEGPVNKTVGAKLYNGAQVADADICWYYRTVAKNGSYGNWTRIGGPGSTFTTSDSTVSGRINSTTFTQAVNPTDIPYTESTVTYNNLAYTTNQIQFKAEFVVNGHILTSLDNAEPGRNGLVTVEERPMNVTQAYDRRIMVSEGTTFDFECFYWKGIDNGVTFKVQYLNSNQQWVDVGSDATLFPAGSYSVSYTVDTNYNGAGAGAWYPPAFWIPDEFQGQTYAQLEAGKSTFGAHSKVTLTLSNASMDWDGLDFRCVFSYAATGHTITADTTMNNIPAQARTAHLVVYAPPIKLTPLKAQSLLLNNTDSSNGNKAWTTTTSNPNNGRSSKEVPIDAIEPDALGKNGAKYGAANDNKAVYTTKITYYGNKNSSPTITWQFNPNVGGGNQADFRNVCDPITLEYTKRGQQIGNTNALSSYVADIERNFMGSGGLAYSKFYAYIVLEDMYPTNSADLNKATYSEWNAVVSLYIDRATNPMDFGDTHFYFRCVAEERYMKNWDTGNMKPYTCDTTIAYNFNRGVDSNTPAAHLYTDLADSSYGAELVIDYNISIKANTPNKATASSNAITIEKGSPKDLSTLRSQFPDINNAINNGAAVYNYKDLAIIAPNGLRYMETYFVPGNGINSRGSVSSADKVIIDNTIRDSQGRCWSDLFEQVTDDSFVNAQRGFAYQTKTSVGILSKDVWEWFWRNAVYYICYDAPSSLGDQVFFYIDEKAVPTGTDIIYGSSNSSSNPYSRYEIRYAGTYDIVLNGAGGGANTGSGRTSIGGQVTLTIEAEEGAVLYFVNGGAGQCDMTLYSGGGNNGGAKVRINGGYNGGGAGGVPQWLNGQHVSCKGASGGGATTVAVQLSGSGRLVEYGSAANAANYVLGVAGGGGANQHGGVDAYLSGSSVEGVVQVHGGTGGGGYFGQGMDGGDFSGQFGGDPANNCEGPGGGGGGWYGGYANQSNSFGSTGCKRDGNGGLNYVPSVGTVLTSDTGAKVKVIAATSTAAAGSASNSAGTSSIKVRKIAVSRFSRTGKNAFDTAYEDTNVIDTNNPRPILITIKAANKLYDGTANAATISVSGSIASSEINSVIAATTITYSNRTGNLAGAPVNASTNENGYARNDCGSYSATAECNAPGFKATYRYENTNPGHTYDNGGSPSDTGATVNFDIYPRALSVTGSGDKVYDRTTAAKLTNATISSGLIAADTGRIRLSTSTVTGYYSDGTQPVSKAGGVYTIVRESDLSLTGDTYHNYYIGSETYTGSISKRALNLHSTLWEDPTYPRNIKQYDGTDTAIIKDIIIDGVLEGDKVTLTTPTIPGKYATNQAGQRLNVDGTVPSDWPYPNNQFGPGQHCLTEYRITQDATPTLTGPGSENYFVDGQDYTGAIARANLTAQVKSWYGLYGDGVDQTNLPTGVTQAPWHDIKAYKAGEAVTPGCWLELDGLALTDTLTLDSNKSKFKTLVYGNETLVPTETTPVGTYPLTYVGLNETNYPELKNYVVMVLDGKFEVAQRPLYVTVVDSDKLVYQENPPFHVNIQMGNVDDTLTDVTSDVNANPILDVALKANDTVRSVLYVNENGGDTALTQDYVNIFDYRTMSTISVSKTNIPFTTDCTIESISKYADDSHTEDDFEWPYELLTCDFCKYNHMPLAPYVVSINSDPAAGPALDVRTATNPKGETVKNYKLIIQDGGLYVHPANLKATVPLYVCMYGNNGTGEVVEPTNYRIINYSTVPIQVTRITPSSDGWILKDVPGMESYSEDSNYRTTSYSMGENTLKRGELYMRLKNTVVTSGGNDVEHSNTAWVIPKAIGTTEQFLSGNVTGKAMRIPMAVYTATGHVNDADVCAPVTKLTYTIAPYGGVMPDESGFEDVPF